MRLPQGLPHLEGARGTIAMAVYIVVTAVAAVLLAGSIVLGGIDCFRDMPATVSYGFRTLTVDQQAVFASSIAPVHALGAKAGDRILAVDGIELPPKPSEFDVDAKVARAGASLTLIVQSGGSPPRTIVLPRRGNGWGLRDPLSGLPLAVYAVLTFLTEMCGQVVLLAASLLLFLRRRHDPEAMLLAFAFSLIAGYGGGQLFWLPPSLLWLMPWIQGLGNTSFPLLICAAATFPDGRFVSRWSRMTALIALLTLIAGVGVSIHNGSQLGYVPSGLLTVATALLFAGILLAVITIAGRLRSARGAERQQIKWGASGFCVSLLGFALYIVVGLTASKAYGPTFNGTGFEGSGMASIAIASAFVLQILWNIALPLGLLVSLLRYRLYDAESAISRSVAYGALTLALLAVFAGSERIIELFGEEYFGHSIGLLAGGLGAGVAAVMIAPLHRRVSAWAERRFQKELISLRHGLPLLLADLRDTASIEELADAVLRRTETGVHAVSGAMLSAGELICARNVSADAVTAWVSDWTPADGAHLDCARGDPLFPMRVPLAADGIGTIGWLLLGPRPDGSFYGKDEREALAEIAEPVARAVAVVRRRTSEKKGIEARFAKLEALVANLLAGKRPLAAE